MDWQRLSPMDFEDVVGDLLNAEWQVRLERFGPGPDGGIDLRLEGLGGLTIVQCKHYVGGGYSKLFAATRREAARLSTIRPSRYVLATSVALTPRRGAELRELCEPHVRSGVDILGARDLEALIRKHPTVVGAHPKLWLTSASQLSAALHASTLTQTAWAIDSAETESRTFVRPPQYDAMRACLASHHCCIVTGPPGIGKTAAARMLLLESVTAGFRPFVASEGIDELIDVLDPREMQVLFFDDFLGQSQVTPSSLRRNEDSRLLRLIDAVASSESTRLIMTSRTYTLHQAECASSRIAEAVHGGGLEAIIVELPQYSFLDRARIACSHIWDLDGRAGPRMAWPIEPNRWQEVLSHRMFNPRIFRTAMVRAYRAGDDATRALRRAAALLADPSSVWRSVFQSHLRDVDRMVLLAVAASADGCRFDVLATSASDWSVAIHGRSVPRSEVRSSVAALEGDFLAVHSRSSSVLEIRVANPSVSDFLWDELTEDPLYLTTWLKSIRTLDSLEGLLSRLVDLIERAQVDCTADQWLATNWPAIVDKIREVSRADPEPPDRTCGCSSKTFFALLDIRRDRRWPCQFLAAIGHTWPHLYRWVNPTEGVCASLEYGHRFMTTQDTEPWVWAAIMSIGDTSHGWWCLEYVVQLYKAAPGLFSRKQVEALRAIGRTLVTEEVESLGVIDLDSRTAGGRKIRYSELAGITDVAEALGIRRPSLLKYEKIAMEWWEVAQPAAAPGAGSPSGNPTAESAGVDEAALRRILAGLPAGA